jgi:hypothetical protein
MLLSLADGVDFIRANAVERIDDALMGTLQVALDGRLRGT